MNKITLFYCKTDILFSNLYDELRVVWATLICEVKKLWQGIYHPKCPYYILPEHEWPHYTETETQRIFRENYEAIQEAQTWLAVMSSYLAMKAKDKADIEVLTSNPEPEGVGYWAYEVAKHLIKEYPEEHLHLLANHIKWRDEVAQQSAFRLDWEWMITSDFTLGDAREFMMDRLFYREFRSEYNDFKWLWRQTSICVEGIIHKSIYKIHKVECFLRGQHKDIRTDKNEDGAIYISWCEYCDTWWSPKNTPLSWRRMIK